MTDKRAQKLPGSWDPEADVQVLVPARPSAMNTVRMTGKLFCESLELQGRVAHLVILAVDEACTNVIKHCYKGSPGKIQVSWTARPPFLEIRVRDWGPRCPQECLKPRDLEELKPGGFGLNFIYSIMDEVRLRHMEDSGNELLMIRKMGD